MSMEGDPIYAKIDTVIQELNDKLFRDGKTQTKKKSKRRAKRGVESIQNRLIESQGGIPE